MIRSTPRQPQAIGHDDDTIDAAGCTTSVVGRGAGRPSGEGAGRSAIEELNAEHEALCRLLAHCDASCADAVDPDELASLCTRLELLIQVEEEVFHAALAERAAFVDEIEAAQVEHRIIRQLIGELSRADPQSARQKATLRVLAKQVRHHVEEEAYQFFPQVRRSDVDLAALGEAIRARRHSLQRHARPMRARELRALPAKRSLLGN